MNKFLIHHRSKHHSNNSGYGKLIDYLDVKTIYGSISVPYKVAKIISSLSSKTAGNYDSASVLKEIELFKQLRNNNDKRHIVHYLNAERDIRHLVNFQKRFPLTTFCASFHKPPNILKEAITTTKYLKKLHGAIAVGSNQVAFLQEWLQLDNVTYIPHGVDTNYFVPDTSKKEEKTLLFVGQHLRDFETFNYCIPKIAAAIKNLKVNVIIHPAYVHKVLPHKSIQIYSGVNDAQLLDFYQRASMLFLPLVDVTACNSILEGLACGLPIVSTKVGGNATYLEGTANILLPKGDLDSYIAAVVETINAQDKLTAIGASSRKKAMEYDWKNIAACVNGFYNKLL